MELAFKLTALFLLLIQLNFLVNSQVSPFGELADDNTFLALEDNSVLNRDTTLYCVTEKTSNPQVTWTFIDLPGYTTVRDGTTDATTGVSTLNVANNKTGYYKCDVSQNGGNPRTYTALMLSSNTAPTSGCDAISGGGRCYSYFNHAGINWYDAREMCLAWGGDLATYTSLEEYTLMYNTITTDDKYCWIGLNDRDEEGTWVWADGSDSCFRHWDIHQPDNNKNVGEQDCGWTFYRQKVDDVGCTHPASCFFCSTMVSPFGELADDDTFLTLRDNSFLNRDTTLYCMTEKTSNPQVTWTFEDLSGDTTVRYGTTDATTVVSTLNVASDKTGYYRCEVSQNGGNPRTYTAVMQSCNPGQ